MISGRTGRGAPASSPAAPGPTSSSVTDMGRDCIPAGSGRQGAPRPAVPAGPHAVAGTRVRGRPSPGHYTRRRSFVESDASPMSSPMDPGVDTPQVVIVGAGPAGLTAAYQLAKADVASTVLEADDLVGGISRTVERDGWRFDLGGHRFFTKVTPVEQLLARDPAAGGLPAPPPDEPHLLRREVLRLPAQGLERPAATSASSRPPGACSPTPGPGPRAPCWPSWAAPAPTTASRTGSPPASGDGSTTTSSRPTTRRSGGCRRASSRPTGRRSASRTCRCGTPA